MGRRKGLTKKTRFEVFKRDSFTCQYYGKKAPDVILEVDHIEPASKGGTNDIMNLITSCFDCNRGKGGRKLSDKSTVEKQRQQMEMLNEKRLQLEMLVMWRNELRREREMEMDVIESIFHGEEAGLDTDVNDERQIKSLLYQFGFSIVYDAAEIAVFQYVKNETSYWYRQAFKKLGGICYNLANGHEKRIYGGR